MPKRIEYSGNLEEDYELKYGYQPKSMTQQEEKALQASLERLEQSRRSKELRPVVQQTIDILRDIIIGEQTTTKMAKFILLRPGLADEVVRRLKK